MSGRVKAEMELELPEEVDPSEFGAALIHRVQSGKFSVPSIRDAYRAIGGNPVQLHASSSSFAGRAPTASRPTVRFPAGGEAAESAAANTAAAIRSRDASRAVSATGVAIPRVPSGSTGGGGGGGRSGSPLGRSPSLVTPSRPLNPLAELPRANFFTEGSPGSPSRGRAAGGSASPSRTQQPAATSLLPPGDFRQVPERRSPFLGNLWQTPDEPRGAARTEKDALKALIEESGGRQFRSKRMASREFRYTAPVNPNISSTWTSLPSGPASLAPPSVHPRREGRMYEPSMAEARKMYSGGSVDFPTGSHSPGREGGSNPSPNRGGGGGSGGFASPSSVQRSGQSGPSPSSGTQMHSVVSLLNNYHVAQPKDLL